MKKNIFLSIIFMGLIGFNVLGMRRTVRTGFKLARRGNSLTIDIKRRNRAQVKSRAQQAKEFLERYGSKKNEK